jgi:tRNA 2-thiouridine synthesizing protein A
LTTEPIEIIDARGIKCPLPVLKLEKRLATMKPGSELIVLATDPMAKVDIPLYCQKHGHGCAASAEAGVLRFAIAVGGA